MVLVQFAVDGEGQYLGTTKNTPASMHHTMRDLWKLLVHDGVITPVRKKVTISLLSCPPPFPSPPPPPPHTLNIRHNLITLPRKTRCQVLSCFYMLPKKQPILTLTDYYNGCRQAMLA